MKKLTKEEIKFQVDQLRKDKLVYAAESAATSLVGLVLIFSLGMLLPTPLLYIRIILAILVLALGYWLFMGIGNLKRQKKIKKLERELK